MFRSIGKRTTLKSPKEGSKPSKADGKPSKADGKPPKVVRSPMSPKGGDAVQLTDERIRELFDEMAGKEGKISKQGWVELAGKLHLKMPAKELDRMFDRMDIDQSQFIEFFEFRLGIKHSLFLQSVVRLYEFNDDHHFQVPANFDYSQPTTKNYGCPVEDGFHGVFTAIRESRDYDYHTNFTAERQTWQDAAISSVISSAHPQRNPWIIFTSGPMGAGKGYTLSWMAENGFFPLSHVVHIDPDRFKEIMPEWAGYVSRNNDTAGGMCHQESALMAEIAQEAVMQSRQHVWVDGSLRDGEWYSKVFDEIRDSHPTYSIAILYVFASEEVIRARVKHRKHVTGRDIPEDLLVESMQSPDKVLNLLTPKVDFVARIRNDGEGQPVLVAYEHVDRSGNFGVIQQRLTHNLQTDAELNPNRFPNSLMPMVLGRVDALVPFVKLVNDKQGMSLLIDPAALALGEAGHLKPAVDLDAVAADRAAVTPPFMLPLTMVRRQQLGIPPNAEMAAWCSACIPYQNSKRTVSHLFNKSKRRKLLACRASMFLMHGGFIYLNQQGDVVAVHANLGFCFEQSVGDEPQAMCPLQQRAGTQPNTVQFGPPLSAGADVIQRLDDGKRWREVTASRLRDFTTEYAFVGPNELVMCPRGAFVFKTHIEGIGKGWQLFPITVN